MAAPVFGEIWIVDTEYQARDGERVVPICMVSYALGQRATDRRWFLGESSGAPPWSRNDLVVCYSATAECGVFAALGWPQPCNILDLWAEYRASTNGRTRRTKFHDALETYGIRAPVDSVEKAHWQDLCAHGSTEAVEAHRAEILAYCENDVIPLVELYRVMAPSIDWEAACIRGRYGACCAGIERHGMPIDARRLSILVDRWLDVRRAAAEIATTNMRFQIFGGENGTQFRGKHFEEYLRRVGLLATWPTTRAGLLARDDATMKSWANRYPDLEHLRQARKTLSMIHPSRIRVGSDGRCRTAIRPFASVSGRNQPRAHTPLAFPAWMRALIQAPPGRALIVADYGQQEFAIAGSFSRDAKMIAAYARGDAYFAAAVACGEIRGDADPSDPKVKAVRDRFKIASIALLYGVSTRGLVDILGVTESRAEALVLRHRRTFVDFWKWSDAISTTAAFDGELQTSLGWRVDTRTMGDRTARNFPIQGGGADILRLATIYATDEGLESVALVHDSIIVETDAHTVGDATATLSRAMVRAGEEVADVTLRVDTQIVGPGDRYFKDAKAKTWWTSIWKGLGVEQ